VLVTDWEVVMIPIEWLNALTEQRDGYQRLVEEAGGLPAAAWKLARARCDVWSVATGAPTVREVRAAAREIVRRLGSVTPVPDAHFLASECEAQGLLVL